MGIYVKKTGYEVLKLRCLFSSYFDIRMEFSTTGLVDLRFFYLTTSFLSCGKTSIFNTISRLSFTTGFFLCKGMVVLADSKHHLKD